MATIKILIFLVKKGVEDLTFSEVISHPKWCHMMQDEYITILQNNTWSLVPFFFGKQAITCRWLLKIKLGINGQEYHYKARIIGRGFQQ